jgi:hypothetical protein
MAALACLLRPKLKLYLVRVLASDETFDIMYSKYV